MKSHGNIFQFQVKLNPALLPWSRSWFYTWGNLSAMSLCSCKWCVTCSCFLSIPHLTLGHFAIFPHNLCLFVEKAWEPSPELMLGFFFTPLLFHFHLISSSSVGFGNCMNLWMNKWRARAWMDGRWGGKSSYGDCFLLLSLCVSYQEIYLFFFPVPLSIDRKLLQPSCHESISSSSVIYYLSP